MPKPIIIDTVRAVLEQHPDGMTVAEIHAITGMRDTAIHRVVRDDERIYIDRWTLKACNRSKQWVAVWCLAEPLKDAPRPTIKPSKYFQEMGLHEM